MSLKAPTIVIFDMDGTSVRHINPRLLHALEWLDDASYKISRVFGWLFQRRAQGPVFTDWDEYANRKKPRLLVHRAIHKFRRKSVEQIVEPCPGIYSVLALLKKHAIPAALVSNSLGAGYGHDVLEKFGLEQYFNVTVFREDIRRSKPDPDPILTAVQKTGVQLGENDVLWYIGDRHKDITAALTAARHLPCAVVPVAYGLNAAVAVLEKNLGPDHIIMSYFDMYAALRKMLKKDRPAAEKSPLPSGERDRVRGASPHA
jgi:phosphoglycolate phosphatase